MPKLYFYDTGLLCSLLGIQNHEQLNYHPLTGNIFENMIVSEIIKYKFNRVLSPQIYFWRDNTGHEVDVIIETATSLFPIEIKSGKTLNPEFLSGLLFYQKISGKSGAALIYGGDSVQKRSNGISVFPWNKVKNVWAEFD